MVMFTLTCELARIKASDDKDGKYPDAIILPTKLFAAPPLSIKALSYFSEEGALDVVQVKKKDREKEKDKEKETKTTKSEKKLKR